MKNFIKSLFCTEHVWKQMDSESLNRTEYSPKYKKHFEIYAVTCKCLKCGKTKIVEEYSDQKI